jgi:hypothetical protein
MHAFSNLALSAIVAVTALGALVMCLLVFRHGFTPGAGADDGAGTALIATRLGHAAAGVCFAVAGILAVVLLVQDSREVRTVALPAPAPAQSIERLHEEVNALGTRLDRAEARISETEARASGNTARLEASKPQWSTLGVRVGAFEASLRQLRADVERTQGMLRQLERRSPISRTATPAPAVEPRPPVRHAPAGPVGGPDADQVAPPEATPPALPLDRPTPLRREISVPVAPPVGPGRPELDTLDVPPLPRPEVSAPPARSGHGSPATRSLARRVEPARLGAPSPVTAPRRVTPEPPQANASEKFDLRAKLRDDWATIKRDSQAAGQDIKNAFRKLRDLVVPD